MNDAINNPHHFIILLPLSYYLVYGAHVPLDEHMMMNSKEVVVVVW